MKQPLPKERGPSRVFHPETTQFFSISMLELGREAPAWVQSARQQLKAGRYAEVQKTCTDGLKHDPRQLDGLLYLAEAFWEQQQAASAINVLKEAVVAAPRDGRPYALLGRYLLLKGLREQAIKFLEQAVTLNPEDVQSRKQLDRTRNLIRRGYQKVDAQHGGDATREASRLMPVPTLHGDGSSAGAPPGALREDTGEISGLKHAARNAAALEAAGVDKAVAALLTGNLFSVQLRDDRGIVNDPTKRTRMVLSAVALLLAVLVGLPIGMLARSRVTQARGGSPLERAYLLICEGTPGTLREAAVLLDTLGQNGVDPEGAQPLLAMAQAIVAVDHGGGPIAREDAERALNRLGDGNARRTPAALMARHLLTHLDPDRDPALVDDLAAALADAPRDAWVRAVAARRLQDAGDEDGALIQWRTAWTLDPSLPWVAMGLAATHARLGDHKQALTIADALLSIRPAHTEALVLSTLLSAGNKDLVAQHQGLVRAALEDKFTAVQDAARLAMALALVKTSMGDTAGAARLFERAATASQGQAATAWQTARIHLALGVPQKALGLLEAITKDNATDLGLHRDLVRTQFVVAMGPNWLRDLRAQDASTGTWPNVRGPLGTVHVRPGYATAWVTALAHDLFPEPALAAGIEGLRDLSVRVQIQRTQAAGAAVRAEALARAGQPAQARTLLEDALKEQRNEPELLLGLARVLLRLDRATDAARYARDALEQLPQDPRARMVLARALMTSGDANGALAQLNALLDAGFESARAHALKARILADKGRDGEATRALKKARLLDPADPDVALAGARVALNTTDLKGALESLAPWAVADRTSVLEAARSAAMSNEMGAVMALAAVKAGAGPDALAWLRTQARNHPKEPVLQLCVGLAAVHQKHKDEAVAALKGFLAASVARDPRRALAEEALVSLGVPQPAPEPKPAPQPAPKRRKRRR